MTRRATLAARWEAAYHDELLNDCLPFWFPRCVDAEADGFLHCRDRDGSLLDTDKAVWAQGRMAWMLLTLYNTVAPRSEWLAWAESGLRFLERHCFDAEGRMYFHVTRDGRPLRQRRYAFSEAFAAIAWAAHARASGDESSVRKARQLFERFNRWNYTPGLMPAKFTDVRPSRSLGPRMITLVTAQERERNLGADPETRRWLDRSIEEIRRWFVKPDLECVMETVGLDGEIIDHFDGRTLNPGHAIEAAWFLMHEGKHRRDNDLVQLGCTIFDWMWARGWDAEYGGFYSFRDVYGKPVQEYWQDMKFWWLHNEAMIASLLAWQLTGRERYARRHAQVRDWTQAHFADPDFGEWYGYLHRDGTVSVPLKGNLWKSCFHPPRALWYCRQLCREIRDEAGDNAAGSSPSPGETVA